MYSYSYDGGKKWINGAKLQIDLGETTRYWNPGKSYRYVLSISPGDIYDFTADIIDWNSDIDVTNEDVVSVAAFSKDPTGGLPSEFSVNDFSGGAWGYRLRSGDATWLKISENADGSGAVGEVVYNSDGTITKTGYEETRKWYLITEPNLTGAPRFDSIYLTRTGVDDIAIPVNQSGGNPFKDCNLDAMLPMKAVYKIDGLKLFPDVGLTNRLKTTADWITFSLDGKGVGVKELPLPDRPGAVVPFYMHVAENVTVDRVGDLIFESTSHGTITMDLAKATVKQIFFKPFKDCSPFETEIPLGAPVGGIYQVKNMKAPTTNCTYKLTTTADWYAISLDGKGSGVKEVVVNGSAAPISFYVHLLKTTKLGRVPVNVVFELTNPLGVKFDFDTYFVGQSLPGANTYFTYGSQPMTFNATKKPRSAMAGSVGKVAHQGHVAGFVDLKQPYNGTYTAGAMNGKSMADDIDKTLIKKVEVVWQTLRDHGKGIDVYNGSTNFKNYKAYANGTAFIKSVIYDEASGYVTVNTNGTGNAVIAAYDAYGTILWNWQIWGTEDEPQASINTGNSANGAGKNFMDRNLGALAATNVRPTEDNAYKYFGMMYQGGRKEPIGGVGSQYTTTLPLSEYSNSIPVAIFDKNGNWIQSSDETGNTKPQRQTKGGFTVFTSVAPSTYAFLTNPLTTYAGGYGEVIAGNALTWTPYTSGMTKTIYDPCPYGYRVPAEKSWDSWEWYHNQPWTKYSINGGIAMENSWWPCASISYSSIIQAMGNQGYYWTSARYLDGGGYSDGVFMILRITASQALHNEVESRCNGMAVRCVQE